MVRTQHADDLVNRQVRPLGNLNATSIKWPDRVFLTDIDVVRAMRGCHAEAIFNDVEEGLYIWVWDFSFGRRRRCMRFLAAEIADPKAFRDVILDEVVARLLPPSRGWFPPGDIINRFSISKTTLIRFRRSFGLAAGNVHRAPLADFLRQRWIGGGNEFRPASSLAQNQPNLASGGLPFKRALDKRDTEVRPDNQTGLFKPFKPHSGQNSEIVPNPKNPL